jgi:hypothetical protein
MSTPGVLCAAALTGHQHTSLHQPAFQQQHSWRHSYCLASPNPCRTQISAREPSAHTHAHTDHCFSQRLPWHMPWMMMMMMIDKPPTSQGYPQQALCSVPFTQSLSCCRIPPSKIHDLRFRTSSDTIRCPLQEPCLCICLQICLECC